MTCSCAPRCRLRVAHTCASLWIFQRELAGFKYSRLVYALLPLLLVSPWIAVAELRNHRIPNRSLLVLWVLIELANVPRTPWEELAAHERSLLAFTSGVIFYWLTRAAIGMGDIKLFAILILSFGNWQDSLLALTYACLVALIWALFVRRSRIAFGPALLIGSLLILISR